MIRWFLRLFKPKCRHPKTSVPYFIFDGCTGQGFSSCLVCGEKVWQGSWGTIQREGSKFDSYWIDPTGVMVEQIDLDCIVCGCPGWQCTNFDTCPRGNEKMPVNQFALVDQVAKQIMHSEPTAGLALTVDPE